MIRFVTRMNRAFLLLVLVLTSIVAFAQPFPAKTGEAKRAEMHDRIGFDMTYLTLTRR